MTVGEAIIGAIIVAGIGIYFLARLKGAHKEGMLAARATGDLWDLGVNVKKLPTDAKAKFFREAAALSTATNGRFHSKRFAMRFFGWYGVENTRVDPEAFRYEGVLAGSIVTMRRWSRKEPELSEAVEKEVKLIFEYLYQQLETAKFPEGQRLSAQLELLQLMKDSEPARSNARVAQ